MTSLRLIVFATLTLFAFAGLRAETLQIKVNRDTSISYHPKERDNKKGDRSAFKVKWFEELGLLDADFKSLKGKVIDQGYLYLKAQGKPRYNLNNGTDISWVSISTIGQNWDEKNASANNNGIESNWGWPGAKIYDVIAGNGFTVRHNTVLESKNGWHRIQLSKEIIAALVSGSCYGVAIMDGSGHFMINSFFYTHEQNNQCPYFEFSVSGTDVEAPKAPTNVKVEANPMEASVNYGAVKVSLTIPKNAVTINVSLDGKEVNRWQIPFAAAEGSTQSFNIRDLKPSTESSFAISVVDASGNESEKVTIKAKTGSVLMVPKADKISFTPEAGEPKVLKGVKVYAFPELVKVDPVKTEVLTENIKDFKEKNVVWSGAKGLVRIAAAKGEIISFQLGFDGSFKDFKLNISDLAGPSKVDHKNVKIWRNWYVKGHAEYALPYTGSFSCPMEDNKIEGQMHQAMTVDYFIPSETKEGIYKGSIQIDAAGEKLTLPLEVKVYKTAIPKEINFNPELNCYGGPGSAGSELFKNSHKLAHYNRCAINRVPYNQTGQVHKDWVPVTDDNGNITNWSEFDKNVGVLLDGSLFKDNPRAGVPVASVYLPFHEGYPLNFRKFYKTDNSVKLLEPQDFKKLGKNEQHEYTIKHFAKNPPAEEAFSQKYKDVFTNCVKNFYKHFDEKGWNKSLVQFYLNNKLDYGYALWTLDEPNVYRDWEALNFYAKLWKEGINDPYVYTKDGLEEIFEKGLVRKKPTFLFRGDISRMPWQGNLSDGLMNIIYVGGGGFDIPRLLKNRKDIMPTLLYAYGACLPYQNNTWGNVAWCLKSYINELDGVLPWQSLGKGLNSPDANGNALIVNAGEYGDAIASFRVHALRRGAQDAELLRLLQLKEKWSRAHIGLFVSNMLNLDSEYKQAFNDEAAAQRFSNLEASKFIELKEAVLMQLEK